MEPIVTQTNQVNGSQLLPSWLFVAAETGVPQPVDTRLQELPFHNLTWSNFEKLCYRLAKSEGDIKCCRIHGEAGHDQDGIDLFAKRAGREKWTVYQCKRVQDFGPSAIEAAVQEFMSGELLTRTECFILCTSESMRPPKRWEAVERVTTKLSEHGVQFEVWDTLELNTRMKDKPLLVADFFHEAWARCFCGSVPENLAQRLSAGEMLEFRRECRAFYEQCFKQADAGWLTGGAGGHPLPALMQRFVGRDVIEQRALAPQVRDESSEAAAVGMDLEMPISDGQKRRRIDQRRVFRGSPEVRVALGDWLARGGQFVLSGEPGAGKSTVLRFLALDLMSINPTLAPTAKIWGDYLPVWVPFPLWTRRIAERGVAAVSLVELLKEWFASYSNSHLWPLVERALKDDRLLLLVDGLDEWRDESGARAALQLLQVFIGQRNTPAVLVGRPQGLSALGPFPSSYRQASLALLSRPQQRMLVERLLDAGNDTGSKTDAFFHELDQLPSLRTTAGVPLLLGLLMRQHLEHARLPVSRFRVVERMVDTLLRDHPIRRHQAALTCESPILAERELRAALAYVAWRTHTERPEGMVESATVNDWLAAILANEDSGLGYPRPEARKIADELLRHGEREYGVVVERAPGWCGFFHRTIQELLAAEHLGTLDRRTQLEALREQAAQPHWREVLLSWCHRRSQSDFPEIISLLEELVQTPNVVVRHRIDELLAELATGDFALPTHLAKRLTRRLVEAVWVCEWPRHRRRLLEFALDGLHGSHAVRSVVQDAVRMWFPCRSGARYSFAAQMGKWPASPELIEALIRTLHREEDSAQRAAAEALGVFAASDPQVAEHLVNVVKTSIRATTRACALDALGRAQIDDPRLADFAECERHSGSMEVALTAIAIRIRKNLQTDEDLRSLLRIAGSRYSDLSFEWRPVLIEAFLNGWPRSPKIKTAVIESVRRPQSWSDDGFHHDIAFPVLIRGFAGDEDAAQALVDFFGRHNSFIHLEHHANEWLPGCSFATHPAVANAVEAHLFRRDSPQDTYSFAQLAILGRTPRVKAHLLEVFQQPTSFVYWPAWALVEGWGADDAEVASLLREAIETRPEAILTMGDLIPRIFTNHDEIRARLLKCLDLEKIEYPWLLLRGIVAVDGHLRSPDVLEACMRLFERASDWHKDGIRPYLLKHAAPDARVRELALQQIDDHDGDLNAVASGFGSDTAIRTRLIALVAPLPAEFRAVLVDRLAAMPISDSFAIEMLGQFDLEHDSEVKTRAAVAYVRRQKLMGVLDSTLVEVPRKMLHALGSDNEERREAGLAALLELRAFDVIHEEFRTQLSSGRRRFQENLTRNKETILKQLAKNWSDLERVFGKEAFVEFTYDKHSLEFANWFAAYAHEGKAAQAWLQSVASDWKTSGTGVGLLSFLSKMDQERESLLSACIEVLHGRVKTVYDWSDEVQTAALFAEQWRGDTQVLVRATAGFTPNDMPEPVVIALALGWPGSAELAHYRDAAIAGKRRVSWNVWHALGTTFSNPTRFAQKIARFAATRGGKQRHVFREAMKCYIARASRDEAARQALLSVLRRAKSPNVRVTLADLLVQAAPGWSAFQEWKTTELAKGGTTLTRAEFGHNLATSNVENFFALLVES